VGKTFYTNVQILGDSVLYRGYENGKQITIKDSFSPTLFVKSETESKFKTLDGINVKPIKFSGVREAKDFVAKYQEVDNFDIYGNDRFLYQYISKHFSEEIDYDLSEIKLVTMDIETTSENGFPNVQECIEEILCITVKDFSTKKILVWGQKEYINARKDVLYVNCLDEETLLRKFHGWWTQNTPDIITGWNVKFFDIPYICKRIERVLSTKFMKSLSPWNRVYEEEFVVRGMKNNSYVIFGVSILDYLELYKKFTYTTQESYRLDHIAFVELGQNKLDHSEYETFKEFYTKGWQKFVNYNIIDVELVDRLEDKMKLIELCLTMAYDAKVNYEDVFSQVRTWDSIIYNYLLKYDIVVPPNKRQNKNSQYEGAYVKEPIPGVYDYVVSFDLNSLYPHLIMGYNISPETLLDQKHPFVTVDKILNQEIDFQPYKDYAVCANGAMYRKDIRGFLPELMEKMYNDRVIFKKKMIEAKKAYEKKKSKELEKEISRCNNIQMAKKISLNSAYGACGNQYFRYFKLANAEAITLSGQVAIRWIENKMNFYLNKILKTHDVDYVIASDTDSIYLNMGPLVETVYKGREKTTENVVSFLDKICKMELEKYIESCYQELADYVNAYDQKMQMKRENIADRGIWTAKKRYILNVWDNEGVRYTKPKLKIMGIEAVKSSTPSFYRDKLKKSFEVIMNGTNEDLIKFIQEVRKETENQKLSDISSPRTANNVSKYYSSSNIYIKATPIQVRGALLYNHYLKKKKLNNKYAEIMDGEKIKFLYLKTPNIINENVIAFIQDLPKEFGLDKYVDYELQFQKAFLDPLKSVLDCIGWETKKQNSLENFFV
jgi:DNA polymerase elongation subunit (family B)